MRLAAFIRANPGPIMAEWETFARTLTFDGQYTSTLTLRDHITEILAFIASDIESGQTRAEQLVKSRGGKLQELASPGERHAALRRAGGFNIDQTVSEFRALRASVTKLWRLQLTRLRKTDLDDLVRFNEVIDQETAESIRNYLKELDDARAVFLGILSHDLRNPLAAARMCAEALLTLTDLDDDQLPMLRQIVSSTDRAAEIVSHLLDLTRARLTSSFPIIRGSMDMAVLAHGLVDEMRAMHPTRAINLVVTGGTKGQWDQPRMGQVLSNLLGNAIEYGVASQPVSVRVEGAAGDLMLSVHNEGVPIAPEAIGGLFDALAQGGVEERSVRLGGANLGLGLYITRGIALSHGGTVEVTSTRAAGTTFTVYLPKYASPRRRATDKPVAQHADLSSAKNGKLAARVTH